MNDPFVCSECARPGPDASDCPCGAGARLDLRDPEVVSMLVLEDDRRLERATQRNLWVGVGVGVAAIVGLLFVAPQVIAAIPLRARARTGTGTGTIPGEPALKTRPRARGG